MKEDIIKELTASVNTVNYGFGGLQGYGITRVMVACTIAIIRAIFASKGLE